MVVIHFKWNIVVFGCRFSKTRNKNLKNLSFHSSCAFREKSNSSASASCLLVTNLLLQHVHYPFFLLNSVACSFSSLNREMACYIFAQLVFNCQKLFGLKCCSALTENGSLVSTHTAIDYKVSLFRALNIGRFSWKLEAELQN